MAHGLQPKSDGLQPKTCVCVCFPFIATIILFLEALCSLSGVGANMERKVAKESHGEEGVTGLFK